MSPPKHTKDDKTLLNNLLFDPPLDLEDRWSMAMLIGVRHNDFGGNRPSDIDRLAVIHNNSEGQEAHCLRAPEDDGVAGDAAALERCRAYILKEVTQAMGTVDLIDIEAKVTVSLSLKYEKTKLKLSRFAFHMGRALHALQDSFTHTYRHPEKPTLVLSVFNYVDADFKDNFDPAIDGVAHAAKFDSCEPGQNLFRVAQAAAAGTELLLAAGAAASSQERLADVEELLEKWLTPSAEACDKTNGYCGVLDSSGQIIDALFVPGLEAGNCGCNLRPRRRSIPGGGWLAVALLLWFLLPRRLREKV
jgi:hypothetical protein